MAEGERDSDTHPDARRLGGHQTDFLAQRLQQMGRNYTVATPAGTQSVPARTTPLVITAD